MNEFLGYLALLAEPIALMVKLINQPDHTEEQEQELLYATQRAIFNARSAKNLPPAA